MGISQSKSKEWQEYMNNNFKKEFNNINDENIYIIELNENRQPKDRCIDAEIIRQYINCNICNTISCKHNLNCKFLKKGGKNNYIKEKSSYDMIKLKNELFKNNKNKNNKNKNNKNNNNKNNKKFQNLLNKVTYDIFGEQTFKQYGGVPINRKRRSKVNPNIQKNKTSISKKSNNPFLKLFEIGYDYETDFKFESDKFIFLIGVKDNTQKFFKKYVLKMTLLDDDKEDDQYVHESQIYEYVQNIKMDNCKFLKYYKTIINENSDRGPILIKLKGNKIIKFLNKMDLHLHRYCLQVSEYNCNYIVFVDYLKRYINQPLLIIEVMKKVFQCKQELFIKHKYIHWDFHSENLFIDITDNQNHVPVFFDFDFTTIKIGDEIVGTDYGYILLGEKEQLINNTIQETLEKIEETGFKYDFLAPFLYNITQLRLQKEEIFNEKDCLILGFFHDDVRFLFDKYYFYDNDEVFKSKYTLIIKDVFFWKYGVELSDEILYFVNSIFDMKNNNFLIEYIFKSIYEDGDNHAREMPGTYKDLEKFEYSL